MPMQITDINIDIIWLISSFIIAFYIESFVIPRIILISMKKHLFDIPNKRKSHIDSISRLGGSSFLPVISFTFFFTFTLWLVTSEINEITSDFFIPIVTMICGSTLLFLLGIKDDLIGVKYSHKLRIQLLAAICLVLGGTYFNNFYGLLGIDAIPAPVGIPFTIFIVTFFINAFNFIDGVDGLASGIAFLSFLTFGFCFTFEHEYAYGSLAFAGAGTLLPFMRYNMSPSLRKIFMGDTGSLTLGLLLSFLALRYAMHIDCRTGILPYPFAVAWAPLFLPMFDATRVILMRLTEKKSPFVPDRKHIHHKLLDCGYSHRKTTFILLTATLTFIVGNAILSCFANINLILCADLIAATLLNHTLNKLRQSKNK